MAPPLQRALARAEQALVGSLPDAVRANVRIELVASLLYGVFWSGCLAFLPVVLRRLGADTAQIALYVTINYVGLIFSPIALSLLRRTSAMRFAAICWALGRGVFVLAALAADAPALLVLAALFWIGESLPSPAYARIMQEIYPPEYRGRAMSGVRVGMTLVVLIFTPLAGWLLDQVGYRWLFPAVALAGAASALIFTRARPLAEAGAEPEQPSLVALLPILRRDRRFALFLLALTIYGLGGVMALPLYPIVQVSRLELSYTTIGALGLVQSLFWLLGFFVWGRLVDRRGPLWVLRLSIALGTLVPLTYVWAGGPWWLLPAFMAQGVLQGGFELGVTNSSIALAERGHVLEYAALQTVAIGVRGMLAPQIGSALIAAGVADTWIFLLSAALVALSWLVLGRVRAP